MNALTRRTLSAVLLAGCALSAVACTSESTRTAGSASEGSDRAAIDRDVTAASIVSVFARWPSAWA